MNKKSIGSNAERELIHLFWKNNVPAIRVAGSGSMKYPSPDIIAGNNLRKLVIECKKVKENKLYIPKNEVNLLVEFAHKFGAEPFIAVKFGKEWYFIIIEDLRETTASYSINTEEVRYKGLLFEDIIKGFN